MTEHRHGFASVDVVKQAKHVLAKRLGLARWKDKGPKALAARLREYERIGNELDSELPAVKPIKPKAPAKGAAGPGFARGDVFRIPLVTGPENFGYFRVVDLIGPKGKLDVIAELLKIPPPNASLEHDFKQSFVQAVRRPQFASEPWRMALRLSGTIRKGLGLERIANVELVLDYSFQRHSKWAAYDCAEAEWNDLPEIARWSFDSLKFLDDAEVVAIARATEPGEFEYMKAMLRRRVIRPYGSESVFSRAAYSLMMNRRDFGRAATVLELAREFGTDPDDTGGRLLGLALYGVGRKAQAEKVWQRSLEKCPAEGRSHRRKTIDEYRDFAETGKRV